MLYEVQGTDENIDVRGELRKPGDRVELSPEDAQELVEKGVLNAVEGGEASAQDTGADSAPAGEVATGEGEGEASSEGITAPGGENSAPEGQQ